MLYLSTDEYLPHVPDRQGIRPQYDYLPHLFERVFVHSTNSCPMFLRGYLSNSFMDDYLPHIFETVFVSCRQYSPNTMYEVWRIGVFICVPAQDEKQMVNLFY